MNEIDELILKVARHLTGVKCVIRWQNPVTSNAVGEVYQGEDGSAIVDVGNVTSQETKWGILLHELAHVKLRHHLMTAKGSGQKPSRSKTQGTSERKAWSGSTPEQQAKELAEKWEEYADRNCRKFLVYTGTTLIEAKLKALLEWKEGE